MREHVVAFRGWRGHLIGVGAANDLVAIDHVLVIATTCLGGWFQSTLSDGHARQRRAGRTEADTLDAVAAELGTTIATNAPLSVAAGKRMVYATVGLAFEEAFAAADSFYEPAYSSEDAQEGPRAFREGRPRNWLGR